MLNELEQLKKDYVAELPARTGAIQRVLEKIIQDIRGQANPNWKELERLTHKLAGSSGTYGFMTLSVVTRYLEELICDGRLQQAETVKAISHLEKWNEVFSQCVAAASNGRTDSQSQASPDELVASLRDHLEGSSSRRVA